jgi:hypothetical protein
MICRENFVESLELNILPHPTSNAALDYCYINYLQLIIIIKNQLIMSVFVQFINKKTRHLLIIIYFAFIIMSRGSIAYKLKRSLSDIPEGEVFDYRRFNWGNEQAVLRTLSRLVGSGDLLRLERGKYYKPRKSRFGTLRPTEPEILKTQTQKSEEVVGYLTGAALYNQLGLTNQVSNELAIVRNTKLPDKEINGYRLKFVTRSFKFRKKDIPLLQLLDAIRDIRDIPDTSADKVIPKLVEKMKGLDEEALMQMVKLSKNYNPATRALLGAIVEYYFPAINTEAIKKSLNPLSKYKLGLAESTLITKSNWNIE